MKKPLTIISLVASLLLFFVSAYSQQTSLLVTEDSGETETERILFIAREKLEFGIEEEFDEEAEEDSYALFAINLDGSGLIKVLSNFFEWPTRPKEIVLSPNGKEMAVLGYKIRNPDEIDFHEPLLQIMNFDGEVERTFFPLLPVDAWGINYIDDIRSRGRPQQTR